MQDAKLDTVVTWGNAAGLAAFAAFTLKRINELDEKISRMSEALESTIETVDGIRSSQLEGKNTELKSVKREIKILKRGAVEIGEMKSALAEITEVMRDSGLARTQVRRNAKINSRSPPQRDEHHRKGRNPEFNRRQTHSLSEDDSINSDVESDDLDDVVGAVRNYRG